MDIDPPPEIRTYHSDGRPYATLWLLLKHPWKEGKPFIIRSTPRLPKGAVVTRVVNGRECVLRYKVSKYQ